MRLDLPALTTDRLLIRPFTMGDLDAAVRVLDEEIYGPAAAGARAARERWLQWTVLSYEQLALLYQPPYGDRAVTLRATGELIGAVGYAPCYHPFGQLGSFVQAPPMRHTAEVGLYWAVAPAHRGRGYAAEAARALVEFAFAEMHLHRIVATTDHDNLASQRVMARLGMRIERNPLPGPPWLQVVGVLEQPAG
ncbi:MAG TPA: GNAT family N-acetyltransferase [Chloroflexaceae bacterium]|nr:GNAT family N-acetyltransferase [Chloroflexaceae bacterium]